MRYGDAWKLRVSAPPVAGRANEAVLALLGRALALPRRRLRLVAGESGRDKVVELEGLAEGEIERRLAAAQRRHEA